MRLQALADSLEFLLVFLIDLRPKHFVRGLAEETPILFGAVRVLELYGLKGVRDLRGQQVTVLEPDLAGRSLQVNINPTAFLEAVGRFQARVSRLASRLLALGRNVCEGCHSEPFAVILSAAKDLALPAQGKLREESRSGHGGRARFLVVPQTRDSSE